MAPVGLAMTWNAAGTAGTSCLRVPRGAGHRVPEADHPRRSLRSSRRFALLAALLAPIFPPPVGTASCCQPHVGRLLPHSRPPGSHAFASSINGTRRTSPGADEMCPGSPAMVEWHGLWRLVGLCGCGRGVVDVL